MKVGKSLQQPIPLLDQYLLHFGGAIPPHAIVDVVDAIFLTLILTIIDIGFRILYECIKYNIDTGREGSLKNLIFALWRGWKKVNGKRYLVSKNLRQQTVEKLVKTHLVMFIIAISAYLIPDRITVFGVQVDEWVAHVFMMLPILFEIASIIEKIQMIDPKGVKALDKIVVYINKIRKG